jgi:uncharacterized membrane protein YbhN (UPF0104 family)
MSKFLKNSRRWLPGALISLLLVAAILYFVDLPDMLAAIRSANYVILSIAMTTSFLWMAVRAVVWRPAAQPRLHTAPYSLPWVSYRTK